MANNYISAWTPTEKRAAQIAFFGMFVNHEFFIRQNSYEGYPSKYIESSASVYKIFDRPNLVVQIYYQAMTYYSTYKQ